MAEGFVGMTISVTLKGPQASVLHGKVVNIIQGQTLALENVYFPASGQSIPSFNVSSSQIADLQVIDASYQRPPLPLSIQHEKTAFPQISPPSKLAKAPAKHATNFADPAILSYGKSPAPITQPAFASQSGFQAPATPSEPPAAVVTELPDNSLPLVGRARVAAHPQKSPDVKHTNARLATRGGDGDLGNEKAPDNQVKLADNSQSGQTGKKSRRGKKAAQSSSTATIVPQQTISPDVSRNGNDMTAGTGTVKSKKGWRSTPLLQEQAKEQGNGVNEHLTLPTSGKTKSKRSRGNGVPDAQNGWATEDATDIQEMGEFDFEANHAKFDKTAVFDQIRNEDTTADEDRLVSHNRLPKARPGTYGGKNLHPTENVLSPPLNNRSSEFGSTSDADTELNFENGRTSRQMSRSAAKRGLGRSNSGMIEDGVMPLNASIMSSGFLHRSMSNLRGGGGGPGGKPGPSSITTTSPVPNRTRSPQSIQSPLEALEQMHLGTKHLMYQPHFRSRATHLPCISLRPERVRDIEAEAIPNLGISAEAITENTARGIAASIIPLASRPGASRRNSRATTDAHHGSASGAGKPVVVVLAGNHTTGARTIAAARHLYGRGYKVLISVSGFEAPNLWNPHLAKQIHTLQALGRKAARIEGWRSTFAHIKKLNGPPSVIVDALLGSVQYNDINGTEHRVETREIIDWANKSRASVVSVACPSGYDATTGESSVLEGEPVAIKPDRVLALGAPLQGVLEAVKDGEGASWLISVIDTGINVAMSSGEMVPFGTEWIMGLEFQGGFAGA